MAVRVGVATGELLVLLPPTSLEKSLKLAGALGHATGLGRCRCTALGDTGNRAPFTDGGLVVVVVVVAVVVVVVAVGSISFELRSGFVIGGGDVAASCEASASTATDPPPVEGQGLDGLDRGSR